MAPGGYHNSSSLRKLALVYKHMDCTKSLHSNSKSWKGSSPENAIHLLYVLQVTHLIFWIFCDCKNGVRLGQGLAIFSVKDQIVHVLCFADHVLPVATTQFQHCSLKAARCNTVEHGWVPKKLFVKRAAGEVLEMKSRDGSTIMWMHLQLLSYTRKSC